MAKNKMTDSVGKKIVDALKMDTEIEITPELPEESIDTYKEEVENDIPNDNNDEMAEQASNFETDNLEFNEFNENNIEDEENSDNLFFESEFNNSQNISIDKVNTTFENVMKPYLGAELNELELPNNVNILKQLITKLPAGVTKQTGALIIKQTMEALGISMRGVLQEAQQVQEQLNTSAHECQASIVEHKKQIEYLDKQIIQYQKQYAALNDVISLFIQTNI